jgi:hypothetical protein
MNLRTPTGPARFALALALAALGAGGCGRAARPADAPAPAAPLVALHFDGEQPPPAHHGVGLVQAFGTGTEATRADVLRSLREHGGRMGCDAVVRVAVHVGAKNAHAIGVCARRAPDGRGADDREGEGVDG